MVTLIKFWYCFIVGVKLAKNTDPDKYVYTGYGTGFDSSSKVSLPDDSVGKNVIIFGVDMSSSVHIDNKKKDVLILGKGPQQGLDDTTLTAEAQYSINFSRLNRKFSLSMHYKWNKSLYLLMLQKYIGSKQMKNIPCV